MFATILVIVGVEFILSLLLPDITVNIGGYELQLNFVFALVAAGYVAGLRFINRNLRRMRVHEQLVCTIVGYTAVTLIPLLLLGGLFYVARDVPELSDLLTAAEDPAAVATFVVAYLLIDALIYIPALFLSLSLAQIGARRA